MARLFTLVQSKNEPRPLKWSRLSRSALAHLLLLATVFVWGATFSLVKSALHDVSPLLFNLLRMALATVILGIVNHRRIHRIPARNIGACMITGFFLAAGYQLQTAGLAGTTPTKSAFLTSLVVVFVPLFTLFPRFRPPTMGRPPKSTAIGAVSAFAGLVMLTTPAETPLFRTFGNISTGDLLSLLCAIAFAGHLLTLAHVSPRVPIPQLATLQIAFATLFMVLTLPLSKGLYLHFTISLAVALAITSIFGTAAAFTVQSWAQRHMQPGHTAVLLTLEPVFALCISLIFLGERFSHRSIYGIALILAGIAVVELSSPTPVAPDPA